MFFSANKNGTVKQNNQSEKSQQNSRLKATVESFQLLMPKLGSSCCCFFSQQLKLINYD